MANKYMVTKNVGTDKFRPHGKVVVMWPTELQMKEEGAKNGDPSFMMVMDDQVSGIRVVGEFSLNTIADCFEQLGFSLLPIVKAETK